MTEFIKRPVTIEAVRWDGTNFDEIEKFGEGYVVWSGDKKDGVVLVESPEGVMSVPVGNWIIKGVKGEFYSCDPEVFKMSYDNIPEVDEVVEIRKPGR